MGDKMNLMAFKNGVQGNKPCRQFYPPLWFDFGTYFRDTLGYGVAYMWLRH